MVQEGIDFQELFQNSNNEKGGCRDEQKVKCHAASF
jgi:hypothetical protein